MQEQKKYHQRKLAIIEMIEECLERIHRESKYMDLYPKYTEMFNNSFNNIKRYYRIKNHLQERYNRT